MVSRSSMISGVLLGALVCFASATMLNQTDIDVLWREARDCYQSELRNITIEGATSRSRRATKMTPESEIMSENSNIFPFFEKLAMEKYVTAAAGLLHCFLLDNMANFKKVFNPTIISFSCWYRHHLTKRQAGNQQTPAACQTPSTNCNGAANFRYRNIDGTCNNLNNHLWGARNTPFTRVAPAAYEDGSNVPRGGFQSYLPNPRFISANVHFDANPTNPFVTNMVPQFGQFLDHDISKTFVM